MKPSIEGGYIGIGAPPPFVVFANFVLARRIFEVRFGHIHVRFAQKRNSRSLGMSALPITDLGGERHATFFATGGAMR